MFILRLLTVIILLSICRDKQICHRQQFLLVRTFHLRIANQSSFAGTQVLVSWWPNSQQHSIWIPIPGPDLLRRWILWAGTPRYKFRSILYLTQSRYIESGPCSPGIDAWPWTLGTQQSRTARGVHQHDSTEDSGDCCLFVGWLVA